MGHPSVINITKSQLVGDFSRLGITDGLTVMLHVSVKAVGWLVGGPDIILHALREVLTSSGTLMMYIGWEDNTVDFYQWSSEKQQLYLDEALPFDPVTSRARRKWSILAEYLRTTPGTLRSGNPDASVAAIGANARYLTENHPLQYGYGVGSPFEKLCQLGGHVLLLGAPLDAITLLHYAEHMANIPNKRIVRYKMPFLLDQKRVWIDMEEFDTADGIVEGCGEYFDQVAQDFLATGQGKIGKVGNAQTYLFHAADLAQFGIRWMERKFK